MEYRRILQMIKNELEAQNYKTEMCGGDDDEAFTVETDIGDLRIEVNTYNNMVKMYNKHALVIDSHNPVVIIDAIVEMESLGKED